MNQSTSTLRPEVSAGQLVFQVASGYMASAALQVAMRLDIAARLSNGPRPIADLAREAGVQTDGLYRVLRALASLGIFAEPSPRTFAVTPAAEFPGGRERTAEEFGALFNRAGFTLTMVVPTEFDAVGRGSASALAEGRRYSRSWSARGRSETTAGLLTSRAAGLSYLTD